MAKQTGPPVCANGQSWRKTSRTLGTAAVPGRHVSASMATTLGANPVDALRIQHDPFGRGMSPRVDQIRRGTLRSYTAVMGVVISASHMAGVGTECTGSPEGCAEQPVSRYKRSDQQEHGRKTALCRSLYVRVMCLMPLSAPALILADTTFIGRKRSGSNTENRVFKSEAFQRLIKVNLRL